MQRVLCQLLVLVSLPFVLGACLETVSAPQSSGIPVGTRSAPKAAAGAQVLAKLESQCHSESGLIFGPDEKTTRQCNCYASTLVKSMSKDDLDFFATYGVVPTLNAARPDEVRKQCGITTVARTGPKSKLPASDSY